MAALALSSTPVSVPTGIRITTGQIVYSGTSYTAGGDVPSVAQWGGGANGIPNRKPDLVLFPGGTATDDGDTDFGTVWSYDPSTGKVHVYGEEALVADSGLTEADAESSNFTARFVAFWFNPDPAGVTTA